jgi:hypothetical protein
MDTRTPALSPALPVVSMARDPVAPAETACRKTAVADVLVGWEMYAASNMPAGVPRLPSRDVAAHAKSIPPEDVTLGATMPELAVLVFMAPMVSQTPPLSRSSTPDRNPTALAVKV